MHSIDFSQSKIGVKKVRFQQTHNQGMRQFLSWDIREKRATPGGVLVSLIVLEATHEARGLLRGTEEKSVSSMRGN